MGLFFNSKTIVNGNATGKAMTSNIPLSFWGGVDVNTGDVQDVHHNLYGQNISGNILCIPYDRGSCSSSGIMLEMIRRGVAPAAIICLDAEPVLTLGSIMGRKLYNSGVAIHTVSEDVFKELRHGDWIIVNDGGGIEVRNESQILLAARR